MPLSSEQRAAISRRQRQAWELHISRKLTVAEIAEVLQVSERTVEYDLAAVRKRRRQYWRKQQRNEQAAALETGLEAAEECNQVIRQAWGELQSIDHAAHPSARARYLNIVLKAIVERIKTLQSLGLVAKAPEEVLLDDAELRRSLRGLSDEDSEILLEAIRQARGEVSGLGRGGDTPDAGAAGCPAALDRGEPVDSHEG